jgi:VIT1/CCC1 family predicted Fe2+/Mn2+ transporter
LRAKGRMAALRLAMPPARGYIPRPMSSHHALHDGGADSAPGRDPAVYGAAVDHVADARQRARRILAGESHLGAVDDWRCALVSARDALIFLWLAWVGLHGFGDPAFSPYLLIALAAGVALLLGISTARSTHAQVAYYAEEFERERREIRTDFEGEREEVMALYAAKGLRDPLLSQVVDVLCADEDRLLKIMMEEELGLSVYHVNHPLLVGAWNFGAALLFGMILALPTIWLRGDAAHYWIPIAGTVCACILAILARWATRRAFVEFFAVSLLTAIVAGGTVFFLARWLAACLVV